ncbi:MAG TPA: phosphoribosylformylglycinamidine synthase subunit PurQ, partial [Acidobacteriota bacterium]
MARLAVIQFPGSNCDADVVWALSAVLGQQAELVWYEQSQLGGYDAVILPGGFAYGDYLRAGALAALAPVMPAVRGFAAAGGPVLGICNGFQVLTEVHLLPGSMIKNEHLHFICRDQTLRVENAATAWTTEYAAGAEITIPLKNQDGQYVADEKTLDALEAEGRVAFRYVGWNPNGSRRDIAGVTNERGNVVGLMPHPEHAVEPGFGPDSREDGRNGT